MITKAIVPIAGMATRMGAICSAVPKAMLPLPAGNDRLVPVMHWILAETASAGAEEAMIILSSNQQAMVEQYLAAVDDAALLALPAHIEFTVQSEPKGFGHAVLQCADFVGDEPFLLMLGDHVHRSPAGRKGCAAQVAEAFDQYGGAAMIAMQSVGEEELPRVGVARGEPIGPRVYRAEKLIEKPSAEIARRQLVTPGLANGQYLAHAGIYLFTPEIFEHLRALEADREQGGGELGLTDAQVRLLQHRPGDYRLCHIDGEVFDTGSPAGYARTFAAFAREI